MGKKMNQKWINDNVAVVRFGGRGEPVWIQVSALGENFVFCTDVYGGEGRRYCYEEAVALAEAEGFLLPDVRMCALVTLFREDILKIMSMCGYGYVGDFDIKMWTSRRERLLGGELAGCTYSVDTGMLWLARGYEKYSVYPFYRLELEGDGMIAG